MPQGHLRFAPVVHPEDCPDLIAGGGLLSENTLKVAIQDPDPPYPRLLESGMLSRISSELIRQVRQFCGASH